MSRARRNGDACEYERSSHECHDLCRTMYRRAEDREDCEELTADNIEKMADVYDALKRAKLNDLVGIKADDLDLFLEVSIAGLDHLIRDYKRSDAEDVLVWIAENETIAEVMRDEDSDFETLEELLELVDSFDRGSVEEPFTRDIDRKTVFEYALSAGNIEAVDYFLDYIFQTDTACHKDKKATLACLTVICVIGRAVDDRDRDYFLDSSFFEDFMDDIIKGTINGSSGSSGDKWIKGSEEGQIDSFNDLDESWADEDWDPDNGKLSVCGGLR